MRRCGSRAMTAGDRQYVADDRIETAEHRQRLGGRRLASYRRRATGSADRSDRSSGPNFAA